MKPWFNWGSRGPPPQARGPPFLSWGFTRGSGHFGLVGSGPRRPQQTFVPVSTPPPSPLNERTHHITQHQMELPDPLSPAGFCARLVSCATNLCGGVRAGCAAVCGPIRTPGDVGIRAVRLCGCAGCDACVTGHRDGASHPLPPKGLSVTAPARVTGTRGCEGHRAAATTRLFPKLLSLVLSLVANGPASPPLRSGNPV